MSRHEIPARDPSRRVVVGWDQPLLTYFVQVYDPARSEDENPVVWLGAERMREIYDLDALKRAIRPYADLSNEIAATLYGDRDEGR